MKIKLKRFLAILTTAATVLCAFSSCAKEESSHPESRNVVGISENTTHEQEPTESESEEITELVIEPTTEAPQLSDECDKVLATGYDIDGSYYELVANETENYSGTTIEMGVVKNNEWSVPLTTICTFINSETGLLNIPKRYHEEKDSGIYDEDIYFSYIGSGCFCLGKNGQPYAVWNGNTGYGYAISSETDFEWYHLSLPDAPNNNLSVDCGGIVLIIHSGNAFPLEYYDTNKNQRGTIGDLTYTTKIGPYSEELFFYMNEYYIDHEWFTEVGFYNLNGEKVIDLSQYDIKSEYETIFFFNNISKIKICNDQGNYYYITIDKSGNVVNSVVADY